jgi:putative transcriptional regulator
MKSRKIFNRINALRHEKGISRRTLAQKIGVNFQTVGYLERQEYNPSLDLAFRISEYFRLPVEFIFSVEPLQPMSQKILEMSKKKGGQNV